VRLKSASNVLVIGTSALENGHLSEPGITSWGWNRL